ncbi:alkaline phosphatase [Arthrobacter sp. RIT-PI-e]|uniref:alkaline phosphatase n=1 Tax=Arthrobacter sp. RIT-PI-e TaxID=1681197 RepID=UPI0006768195|nr:alkaline phosphatase [Arthrobacter sp. RIT-PI-e]KNC18424.1 alkaline phosphatase [Arthrobacter sp. RIT-PI-e]
MRRKIPVLASATLAGALLATMAAGGAAGPALANVPADVNKSDRGRAQNVILLVGDGMGRTHVTAGRERFEGAAGLLTMETLPSQGYVKTYAVEENSGQPGEADFVPNLVTDSASSATAWSSGVKSYNAALGVDAKGQVVPTAMELAKQAGYRTGNVSTAEITDATPAGQMSHVLARGCQGPVYSAASCQNTEVSGAALATDDIRVTPVAKQIARNGTADVIFGGGLGRFDAADEQALQAQGYSVLGSITDKVPATRDDLQAASGAKVFGLFNTGNLTVEKTKQDNPTAVQAAEPSLSEMTSKAIDVLVDGKKNLKGKEKAKSAGKGFFLQVEGALIDKRSHANDAAQTLEEIKAFDDAVAVALDFAERDRNTLVIVTADHECAGFNIIEKGTFTNAEALTPPSNVDSGNTANNSAPSRTQRSTLDPARSTGPVNGAGAGNAGNFAPATFRTADDAADVQDGSPEASLWLTYLSGNHTGADVPIYSYGPGSSAMSRTLDNTELFGIMTDALRLRR